MKEKLKISDPNERTISRTEKILSNIPDDQQIKGKKEKIEIKRINLAISNELYEDIRKVSIGLGNININETINTILKVFIKEHKEIIEVYEKIKNEQEKISKFDI